MNFRILSNHLKRTQFHPVSSVSVYKTPSAQRTIGSLDSVNRRKSCAFHTTPNHYKIIPFLLADIGEGITECEVIQWFVKEGDKVEQFSKICEVQSDKAAVEITSRFDGTIKTLKYEIGQVAKVGSPLVEIDVDEEDAEEAAPKETLKESSKVASHPETQAPVTASAVPLASQGKTLTFATPAVRRVAMENQVDLTRVSGTGPGGRILKGDVLDFVNNGGKSAAPLSAPIVKESVPTGEPIPLTPVQKGMFKAMTKSLAIPHFGYSDEIILNEATQFRAAINAYLKSDAAIGLEKISFMPIFIKALSLALNKYPLLNAALVNDEDVSSARLVYRADHNVGVAMDTPLGLLVPNVKNVETKSILEIALELERLKDLGRRNALSTGDLSGGTITLSNIGTIGGTLLHPVLVQGQVCIGALGKVQTLARYTQINGVQTLVPQNILPVSFNADHRIVDGATMARFVQVWKHHLESPALLSLQTR